MEFPDEMRDFLDEIGFYEKIKNLKPEDLQAENEKPNCEDCPGLEKCPTHGYLISNEEIDGKIFQVYAKCPKLKMFETQLRYSRNIRTSGLPKAYMNKTFDNYDAGINIKAIERIKQYLKNKEWRDGYGLFITGPVGCGKTHIASAIVHELAKENIYTLFVFVPDFLDEIRASYHEDEEDGYDRENPFELAKQSTVLVLDDLGTEKITEWAREKLLQLINYRMNNKLATIITTNLSMNDISERLGERIQSRLKLMCEEIKIMGKDKRG
jgi:DNA replication protein DnaC